MSVPYVTVDKAIRIAKEYGGSGSSSSGEGKNWTTLNFTQSQLQALMDGKQISIARASTYEPSNFRNDYFRAIMDVTGSSTGEMISVLDPYDHVYIDLTGDTPDWYSADISKFFSYIIQDSGYSFNYNYYKTALLFNATNSNTNPILEQDIRKSNSISLTDVTPQDWENNDEDSTKVEISREKLETQNYGAAYVLAVNQLTADGDSIHAVLICYEDSRAAYWDNDAEVVKWAYIEAGKAYHVYFDDAGVSGGHDTDRWLLTGTHTETIEEETYIVGNEMTDDEKEVWYSTGFEFSYFAEIGQNPEPAYLYEAQIMSDKLLSLKANCVGVDSKELMKLFSWNEPFAESPEEMKYEFIARPAGYYIDTYLYYDEELEEEVLETEGEYVWYVTMDNVDINLITPVGKMNTIYAEVASSSSIGIATPSYSSRTIYRHTFSIYNNEGPVQYDNKYWYLRVSFMAVNAQYGDSSINYILFSDESYNYGTSGDWILPVTGTISWADSETGTYTVAQAVKITAKYRQVEGETYERALFITYIDPADGYSIISVPIVNATNCKEFNGTDFISEIGDFLTY